ncbi:MAG: DUF3306 domain-containing protein [Burkholderiales bacterium]
MAEETGGFLSRWARRKEQARSGVEPAPELPAVAAEPSVVAPAALQVDAVAEPVAEPLPTLADVALLSRDSDYSRFVACGVDEGVKRAAMKKLFADPHFNIMDGLDTYIDDYGRLDPIPLAMLRQMNQSKFLRLFDDDEEEQIEAKNDTAPVMVALAAEPLKPSDDDADLRLQQDDAAGRPGPDQGTRT